MEDQISVRELHDHTSAVLRRVEGGAHVRVTVDRRPVAQLIPLDKRPAWVSGPVAHTALSEHRADPALRSELAALLPQTTDEL